MNRIQMVKVGLLLLVLNMSVPVLILAKVTLPSIFSDHMVLQRGMPVPIWGWADPGEQITLSIAGQIKTTTADEDGKWVVKLNPLSDHSQLSLTVKGRNTVVIEDVLVGEVWLAAGQSNMQLSVNDVTNAWKEKVTANFPQIRMFTVSRHPAVTPQTNCDGQWVICSPKTVGNFSAAAYFFARELHQNLEEPVGMIHASWGATPIETWTSMPRMEGPEFEPVFKPWQEKMRVPYDASLAEQQYVKALTIWTNRAEVLKSHGKNVPPPPKLMGDPRLDKNYPANLFNGMIAPIIGYAIRGAIWYQGENNAGSDFPQLYSVQLPLLIQDWRKRWDEGDFPFAWVQLPNFQAGKNQRSDNNWSLVREAMLRTLSETNTGMAITIDVGDPKNIHPKNKQAVGHRLALWALAKVYGKNLPYSGPLPAGQTVEGNKMILSFVHTDGGLVVHGAELKGFVIAGADHQWVKAIAEIQGDHVIVSSPEVQLPLAVRYGWASNPDCNLFNGAGLPASPFRTDDWK